jgi:hypothetical protein
MHERERSGETSSNPISLSPSPLLVRNMYPNQSLIELRSSKELIPGHVLYMQEKVPLRKVAAEKVTRV